MNIIQTKNFRLNHKYSLKNRLVLAPMTTCQSNPDGSISLDEMNWLKRVAADGYGMIITCAAAVSKSGIGFKNQLSIVDNECITGLGQLTDALNSSNLITIIQLSHAGSRANPDLIGSTPYSASSYTLDGVDNFIKPQTLAIERIYGIINDFAQACLRAYLAGFHGVEIHGCNGYLVTQFISQMTNQRDDEFGGCLENRARLAREIIREARRFVPSDFIIGFRLSFENSGMESGLDVDENIQIANWLIEDGINYLHISGMSYSSKCTKYPDQLLVPYIKSKLNSIPLIVGGGISKPEQFKNALDLGADLVSVGRAAIGNPYLVNSLLENTSNEINLMPYKISDLKSLGISDDFINYIKNNLAALKIIKTATDQRK